MTPHDTGISPATSYRPKLMDQLRRAIQTRHSSPLTEQSYCYWVRYYIRFNDIQHPAELNEQHVARFLHYLAHDCLISEARQQEALAALSFLYTHVLGRRLGKLPPVRHVVQHRGSHTQ